MMRIIVHFYYILLGSASSLRWCTLGKLTITEWGTLMGVVMGVVIFYN